MRLLDPLRRRLRKQWLPPPREPRRVIAYRPEMHALVASDARIERLCTRLAFTEGPLWIASRQALVFSDIPTSRILEWRENRLQVLRRPSGHANGNTLDTAGRIITCEHSGRRVSRQEADGSITALATHWQGKRLNSPNDLVVQSDGAIYFTDPPFGIKDEQRELGFSGVYRIAPDGKLSLLTDSLAGPNGLAFSADETRLYVDDSTSKTLHAFPLCADGTLNAGEMVLDMDNGRPGNPDGMKLDAAGNLFVTGPGGIWVLSPGMEHLGMIELPEIPANCAWGDDGHSLYVTARRSLYRIRCLTSGHLAGQ